MMGSIEYKVDKLSSKNYSTWKTVIMSHLMSKDLWEFVRVEKTDVEDQLQKNEQAKHLMYIAMDPQQIAATGVCGTAYDLWRKIKENHEGAETNLRNTALADFLSLKYKKNESIISYAGRFEMALGKLETTNFMPDEKTKLWVLTNSLPSQMKPTVQIFTMANPDGKVSELITELKIQFHLEGREIVDEAIAFHISKSTKDTSNSRTQTCSYCKNKGHVWKECRKLKAKNDAKKHTLSPNQTKPSAFRAETHSCSEGKYTWIVDSGASNHMTQHKEFMQTYEEFTVPKKITLGNGEHLLAMGQGSILFKSFKFTGQLQEVLYVPELTENLFSVCSSMKLNCKVSFKGSIVNFVRDGKLVLQAKKRTNSIYFLLELKPKFENSNCALLGASLDVWHKRMAHCSSKTIESMAKKNLVTGLKITNQKESKGGQCKSCILNKITRCSHPERTNTMGDENSAVLHFDTVGPIRTPTIGGSRYFVLATEEYSGFRFLETISTKGEIAQKVLLIINKTELQSKRAVKSIITDNGTEFLNKELDNWLQKRGVVHLLSTAYTPEQNGRAERENRSILDATRTLLNESKLPEELWGEAANTANYVLNRTTSKKNSDATRFELLTGKKPDVSNFKVFGQPAIIRKPDVQREGKLCERGKEVIFVGYTDRFNTYRFLHNDRIIISCDAVFLNSDMNSTKENVSHTDTHGSEDCEEPEFIKILDDDVPKQNESSAEDISNQIQEEQSITEEQSSENINQNSEQETTSNEALSEDEILQPTRPTTRSQTRANDQEGPSLIGLHFSNLFTLNEEPLSVNEAKTRDDWSKWQLAMDEEIKALKDNMTWTLIDRPIKCKPIKSKWVFKLKLGVDGSVDRYKARLVAKGYSQVPERDYSETYAPTASMTTIRLVLSLANQNSMNILQFDVKTAFLHGEIEENLLMEQPELYEQGQNKVCKLLKSLYGLKQSPYVWNKKFDSLLKHYNLKQSHVDKCLYFNEEHSLILVIYVDDGLIASKDENLTKELIKYLKDNFELKVMKCESYLGFKVEQNLDNGTLSITQSHYIKKLLTRFGMNECKIIDTPEQVGAKFSESPALPTEHKFKELVGCLIYLSTCSRPDISHAVSIASRTSQPTEAHYTSLKRILRYLKGSKDLVITYKKDKVNELEAYSDADYANDEQTRKSNTGFVIYYGGGPIAWRCQKQPIVTLSTTEAEYVAGCELVKNLLPIREQLIELKQISPSESTKVFIDNTSTIKIASNESQQSRTKHIDVRHKWLSEKVKEKKVELKHISGEEQAADILTKPLYKSKFLYNRSKLLAGTLVLLTTLMNFSSGANIKITDPLTTVPSDYSYIKGDIRYKLTNTFVNPCETLFQYSTTLLATETLIRNCFDYYEKKLLTSLPNCQRRPTVGEDFSKIPLSYDCVGNQYKGVKKIENLDISHAGRCEVTRQTIVKNIASIADLKRKDEAWNIHKKKIDSLPILKRNKKAIPLLAIAGIALSAYATGKSIQTYKVAEANTQDMDTLMSVVNNHSAILREATNFFEQYRDSITAINAWTQDVEDRLGNDVDDSRLTRDPLYRGKKAHLVRTYMNWFDSQEKLLMDINSAAGNRMVPMSLITSLNLTEGKLSNWSSLYDCNYRLENKSMILELDFSLPILDHNIEILSVVAMNFYQYPDPEDANEICWFKYVGPPLVLFNKTSKCLTKLNNDKVYQRAVRAQTCTQDKDDLHPKDGQGIWNLEDCEKQVRPNQTRVQIHEINGLHKIYCHPYDIQIENDTIPCPNAVFLLDGHVNYKIDEISHQGGQVDATILRQTKPFLNETLKRKKRSKRSALGDLPILKVPSTTTTTTTSTTTTITTAEQTTTPKPKPAIVSALESITNKMNSTIEKVKERIKDLPANLTTTRMTDSIFSEPLELLSSSLNVLADYFRNFGTSIGLMGVCLVCIMIVPIIEILFISAKIISIPVNLWVKSLKRVTNKVSMFSRPDKKHKKTNWHEISKVA